MLQSSRPALCRDLSVMDRRGSRIVYVRAGTPEIQLGLGPSRVLAIRAVPVPETSVHKNDFTSAPEHQVWVSRQAADVQSVSVPHAVNQAPDRHLRLRVLRPNPAHPLTALRGGQGVHTASLF